MHREEFKSSDQANHGSPARFTWRSRFREARDQDSLWFVSYVSKRKGGRQVRRGKVSFKKKKMTLEKAFVCWKAARKSTSGHKANSRMGGSSEPSSRIQWFPSYHPVWLHANTLQMCCSKKKQTLTFVWSSKLCYHHRKAHRSSCPLSFSLVSICLHKQLSVLQGNVSRWLYILLDSPCVQRWRWASVWAWPWPWSGWWGSCWPGRCCNTCGQPAGRCPRGFLCAGRSLLSARPGRKNKMVFWWLFVTYPCSGSCWCCKCESWVSYFLHYFHTFTLFKKLQ